jgi:uncharacterized protein (TIGR03437 family)
MFRFLIGLILAPCILYAQPPAIGQNGVTNAASLIPPTLPGSALARGARFRIQGVRLAGSERTSVDLTLGEVSRQARILSETPLAIEAIVPLDAPLGSVEIRVRRGSELNAAFPVTISASNPGLYSTNGFGWGPGRILNLQPNKRDNSLSDPARPLDHVAILATGSGDARPEVFVGSKRARLLGVERSAQPGIESIIIEIPSSAPEGCFVPLYALSPDAGASPSNMVTISIQRGTGACRALADFPIPFLDSAAVGMIVISRVASLSLEGKTKWVDEDAIAAFVRGASIPPNTPLLLTPPVGTCTAYTGSSQSPFQMPQAISDGLLEDLGGVGLDAGAALTLTNATETRVVPQRPAARGFYRAPLGTTESRRRPLFLNSDTVRLSTSGGRDVGPFDLTLRVAPAFTWANRESTAEVDRHRPLTLTWTPAKSTPLILIFAVNVDRLTTARAICYCVANGAEGKFTIQPEFLAHFPPSRDLPGEPLSQVLIAAPMLHSPETAPGIRRLQVMTMFVNLRNVVYR